MLRCPFKHHCLRTFRQTTLDDFQRANVYQGFVLTIQRMKVRWRMFSPEHSNDDPEELADSRHVVRTVYAKGAKLGLFIFPLVYLALVGVETILSG